MAKITWYSGNDGTKNVVRTDNFSGEGSIKQTFNLKQYGGQNDEIRSAVMEYLPVGSVITVYDNPDGKKDDDWSVVTIKQYDDQITIPHFEQPGETSKYKLVYNKKNGLNGKISCVDINIPEQKNRDLYDYIADSIIEEIGNFNDKSGKARKFKNSGSEYRLWEPEISRVSGQSAEIYAKLDHIRGGNPDDHGFFTIKFDEKGLPSSVESEIELSEVNVFKSVVDVGSKVAAAGGQAIEGLMSTGLVEEPNAKAAAEAGKFATAAATAVLDEISANVAGLSESGGRKIFKNVIKDAINEVCRAVIIAYQKYQFDVAKGSASKGSKSRNKGGKSKT
jgi:hypothetical protein